VKPLRVTADLSDAISLTYGTIALDALLASLYAMVQHLPPMTTPEVLPLPLAREPGGKFDLASFAVAQFDRHDSTHFHKQFPHREAKHHSRLKRADMTAGINKSHRIPLSMGYPADQRLTWWCVGDQAGIEDLLQYCHHIGKKRAHGMGRVLRWDVAECEPWDDGFPVVMGGMALRPLPPDWPGLVEPDVRMSRLTYPYWPTAPGQMLCAVPEVEA
jgi:hypothetical protein